MTSQGRARKRTYGRKADRALDLWVKLARAFATFDRHAQEDIRTYGLTQPQFGVLEALGHLGPLTLGELSRKLLSSGGNTTVIVDNLEKEGLLRRRVCAEDRRVSYVELTGRGTRLLQRIFPPHAKAVARLASVLSAAEQVRLAALLRKLGTGLRSREELF
ncbi:MAG: MarR family transcriptional regulator [Bacteroidetes bacterium]|nr:MarR family transcriptional regulator [Bacteroidota bacterium]